VRANTSGSWSVKVKATSIVAPGSTGWASGSSITLSSVPAPAGSRSLPVRSAPATRTESTWM
jgi:hypothetical protein